MSMLMNVVHRSSQRWCQAGAGSGCEWKADARYLGDGDNGAGVVHHSPAAVSATQVTEAGTLYTLGECARSPISASGMA